MNDDDANPEVIRARLTTAGRRWADALTARAELADEMADLARKGAEAGIAETEMAELLGVDRARTLRRWLGK